ncbi:3D domain-containing protein [Bacillus sp. FSL R10-2789]|uniref:3D domain-containing protein n=1 Tax=Bacillus sp. FSL R10-2789 TaxID=2954662 RepID=UPI0030FA5FDB
MRRKVLIATAVTFPLLLSLFLGDLSRNLSNQVKAQSKKIELHQNQNAKLERTNVELQKEKATLESEKQKADNQVTELTNERSSLNEQVNDLSNQLEQTKQKLEVAEKKAKELESKPVASSPPKVQSAPKVQSTTTQNSDWKNFMSTAYTTHANGDKFSAAKWGDLTATGTTVKQGRTIAVDKNVIPLGSKVEIQFPPEYSYLNGVYIAEDTGNAIIGNKIDVYLDSIEVANQFGIRNIKLRIL